MNKLSCGIIKDLLPLYSDSVCGEETLAAVEEHLNECESCSKELEKMKISIPVNNSNENIEKAVKKANKKIKKIKKKTALKTIAIILVAASVIGFFGFFRISCEILQKGYWDDHQHALGEGLLTYSNTKSHKPNFESVAGKLYINECHGKYKVTNKIKGVDETHLTTTLIAFSENKSIAIVDTSYEELNEGCYFPTKKTKSMFYPGWVSISIIKKGFENLGIDTEYQAMFNLKSMQELLTLFKNGNAPYCSGLLCSPTEFINAYAVSAFFYQTVSLDGADNYIICESDSHYGYGRCTYEKNFTRYNIFLQDKNDILNQRQIQFTGFTEEEVKEIYDSFEF